MATTNKSQRQSHSGTASAAQLAFAYQPKDASQSLYTTDNNLWDGSNVQASNFFAATKVRFELSSGTKALGDSISFKIKRTGHLLVGLAIVMELKGVVGYAASPAAGVPNTSGWINNMTNGTILRPWFVDQAGFALLSKCRLDVSTMRLFEFTNDSLYEHDQLFGIAGKSAGRFTGKHGATAASKDDEAALGRIFIVEIPFAFGLSSDFAFPMSIASFHGMEVVAQLGDLSTILRVTSATEEDAGTSSSSALLYRSGGVETYVRPDGVAWGASAPSTKASNASILGDIYVYAAVVFLTKQDAKSMMEGKRRLAIPNMSSRVFKYTETTKPTADSTYTIAANHAKKKVAAIFVRPRQASADFANSHGPAYSEAPTINRHIIKNISLKVDDQTHYEETAEENQFSTYQAFQTMPDDYMYTITFAPQVDSAYAMATRGLHKATDVNIECQVEKEAFESNQTVNFDVTVLYISTIEIRQGVLFASAV